MRRCTVTAFPTNPVTGLNDNSYQSRYAVDWSQHNKVYGIDNIAQAKFKTADIDHTVLLGVDYYHFNSKFLGLYDRTAPGIDLYNPVYGSQINFRQPYKWDNTITQTGLYAQDQLRWNQWFLTLGGRYDFAETDNKQPGCTRRPTQTRRTRSSPVAPALAICSRTASRLTSATPNRSCRKPVWT